MVQKAQIGRSANRQHAAMQITAAKVVGKPMVIGMASNASNQPSHRSLPSPRMARTSMVIVPAEVSADSARVLPRDGRRLLPEGLALATCMGGPG